MEKLNRNLAVIVGIDNYQNGITELSTAANDANALAQVLREAHQYEQIWQLVDPITGGVGPATATRTNLETLLTVTLPAVIQENNRLLFYFAGHGIALNGDDGPRGYLIPQDAKLGDVTTYLPMPQVEAWLTQLPCRHCLVILDCCFAGAFRWSSTRQLMPITEVIHKERYDRFVQDAAWQVITSTSYDQYALDNLELKNDRGVSSQTAQHSPFAAALLRALEGEADAYPLAKDGRSAGDGVITATELYLYLRDHVEVVTDAQHRRQTPGLWCLKKHDKGEYIFLVPGHVLNLPNAPTLDAQEENNPYRGLKSYDQEHSDLFFGRTALTEELAEMVASHSLTVVLGASGSGKSSLVKAGLIPYLGQSEHRKNRRLNDQKQLTHVQQWKTLAAIRPGETPLMALSTTLKSSELPLADDLKDELDAKSVSSAIANWSLLHPDVNLLLVIDQFEELITLCRSEQEREQFLSLLAEVLRASSNQLHLVLTLRSDFEPQFRNTALEDFWREARFIVPAMKREELREAIEEPASAKVVYFQPHSLVDLLIDEVAEMPGALPLLSFTLSELYLKLVRRYLAAQLRGELVERAITQADYDELGGVTRSLTQRADQEYEALVQQDPAYAQTVRMVMLRMVAVGGELARRRVLLSELEYPEPENTRVRKVVQWFSTARLLVSGTDAEGQTYVEPAHDALVRGWQRLSDWKKQDLANLLLQRELTPTATKWLTDSRNKQSVGLLWNNDPRLPLVEQVRKTESGNWLNAVETEFVNRSIQRRRNNQRRLFGSVTFAFLSISTAAVSAFWQQNMAMRREVSTLTASSETRLLVNDQLGALVDSVKAGQRLEDANTVLNKLVQVMAAPGEWIEIQARSTATLHRVLSNIQEQNRLEQHSAGVNGVDFSPECPHNEPLLVSASVDGSVKLWTLDGAPVEEPLLHREASSVHFSQDCQLLVSASNDGTIKSWKRNGELFKELSVRELPGLNHLADIDFRITDVNFSPNDQTIAAAIDYTSEQHKGHIGLWKRDGTPLKALEVETDPSSKLSFSRDGKMMVLGSRRKLLLWELDNELPQKPPQEIGTHKESIESVDISPNGTMIAASSSGNIKLWEIDGKLQDEWQADDTLVRDLRFSPNGQVLASVGDDTILKLWCVEPGCLKGTDPKPIRTLAGHGELLNSVDFSSDGDTIATASSDHTIKLWNLNGNSDVAQPWKVSNCETWQARFNQGNHILVRCNSGTQVWNELWNLNDKTNSGEVKKLGGRSLKIEDDTVNPESEVIAAIDEEKGTVIRYDSTGNFLNTLGALESEITKESIQIVRSSPNGKVIVVVSEINNNAYSVKLWNVESNDFTPLKLHDKRIIATRFSPNGKILALATEDDKIMLWDLEDNQNPKSQPPFNGTITSDQTFRFSPDNQFLAFLAPTSDKTHILLWSVEQQKLLSFPESHNQLVTEIRFSPDSKMIASGSLDNTVRLWNLNRRKPQSLTGHSNPVQKVIFRPNQPILASVDSTGEIRLWSFEGRLISILKNNQNNISYHILDISFTQDGKKLLVAEVASDKIKNENITQVTFLDLDQEHLMQLGCDRLKNYLNNNQNISQDKAICQ